MRYALAAIAILATLAGVWFVFAHKPAVTNYPSQGSDVIAIGDSLVFGTGAGRGSGFVSVLERELSITIANLGRAGDTTADVRARLHELDEYDPKLVILLAGGNDYLRQVPDDTVFANLAAIIEYIHGKGAMVVLVGIRGGVIGDPYAARFKQLAEQYGTAYVPDALQGLFGDKRYMTDTVHPNEAGYALLAARIAPVVKDLLQ
ncbi:MAG: hypothetical protein KA066_00855 [Candidatus Pacebacteria bacterium]|nr:hypothetical protein [Candidatus Paceibacterota bacterium]